MVTDYIAIPIKKIISSSYPYACLGWYKCMTSVISYMTILAIWFLYKQNPFNTMQLVYVSTDACSYKYPDLCD